MTDADKQFSYDETLLEEGRYKEWFYQGLDPQGKSWLQQPTQQEYTWNCYFCGEAKTKIHFTKSSNQIHRRCNSCVLTNRERVQPEDSSRWENKHNIKHWMDQAACLDADPDIFFPSSVDGYLDPDAKWRQYCPECPIKDLCIEQIKASTTFPQGIFGGKYFSLKQVRDETTKRRGRPRKAK